MNSVHESDGYYMGWFATAVDRLGSCTARLAGRGERRGGISYLFEKYADDDIWYFREEYGGALRAACTTADDMLQLKSLLEDSIPDRLPDAEEGGLNGVEGDNVKLMIHVLGRLEDGAIAKFYKKYRMHMPEVCESYGRHLAKTDRAGALKVAKKAIREFPHYTELKDLAHTLYEKTDPEYKTSLRGVFLRTRDWKHYDELREISADWDGDYDTLTRDAGRLDADLLVAVLLRENLEERALRAVLKSKGLKVVRSHHDRLCPLYPDEYHRAYAKRIDALAKTARRRDEYREVASHLKAMKTVPGHAGEFGEFVETLRKRYARRPAFLDEMKSL